MKQFLSTFVLLFLVSCSNLYNAPICQEKYLADPPNFQGVHKSTLYDQSIMQSVENLFYFNRIRTGRYQIEVPENNLIPPFATELGVSNEFSVCNIKNKWYIEAYYQKPKLYTLHPIELSNTGRILIHYFTSFEIRKLEENGVKTKPINLIKTAFRENSFWFPSNPMPNILSIDNKALADPSSILDYLHPGSMFMMPIFKQNSLQ